MKYMITITESLQDYVDKAQETILNYKNFTKQSQKKINKIENDIKAKRAELNAYMRDINMEYINEIKEILVDVEDYLKINNLDKVFNDIYNSHDTHGYYNFSFGYTLPINKIGLFYDLEDKLNNIVGDNFIIDYNVVLKSTIPRNTRVINNKSAEKIKDMIAFMYNKDGKLGNRYFNAGVNITIMFEPISI